MRIDVALPRLQAVLASVGLLVYILLAAGCGNDSLDPPEAGMRVVNGRDGWHMALPEAPVKLGEEIDIWVYPDRLDNRVDLFIKGVTEDETVILAGNVSLPGSAAGNWTKVWPLEGDPSKSTHVGPQRISVILQQDDRAVLEGDLSVQ